MLSAYFSDGTCTDITWKLDINLGQGAKMR